MIAIYYVTGATPLTLYSVEVQDSCFQKFMVAIEKEELPMPSEDIIFIENDKVVNQYNTHCTDIKTEK